MVLGKPEVGRFKSVSEQDIEKRDHGIDLGQVGGLGRLGKDQGEGEIHQVAEETARDGGHTIP